MFLEMAYETRPPIENWSESPPGLELCWYSAIAWPPSAPTCQVGLSTMRQPLLSVSAVGLPKPWFRSSEPAAYCSQKWLPPPRPRKFSCTCSSVAPQPCSPLASPPCESPCEYEPTRRSLPPGLTGMSYSCACRRASPLVVVPLLSSVL